MLNNLTMKLINNLRKYDEETSPVEEKIEINENYIAHLGLYSLKL